MSVTDPEPDEPEEPDFKNRPGTPGGDVVDERLCLEVSASYRKIMESERVTIDWMTGELGNQINSAMHAAYQSLQMQMMREGLEPAASEQLANMQLLLLAFELGRKVGLDQAGAQMMREMLGDDFGKDFM